VGPSPPAPARSDRASPGLGAMDRRRFASMTAHRSGSAAEKPLGAQVFQGALACFTAGARAFRYCRRGPRRSRNPSRGYGLFRTSARPPRNTLTACSRVLVTSGPRVWRRSSTCGNQDRCHAASATVNGVRRCPFERPSAFIRILELGHEGAGEVASRVATARRRCRRSEVVAPPMLETFGAAQDWRLNCSAGGRRAPLPKS